MNLQGITNISKSICEWITFLSNSICDWHVWAIAHMGHGPYGPRPIWARAHMGPGPLGPGPFLVGQTPHQKTHPGKKSANCVFCLFFGNKNDARRPCDHFGGGIAPRSPSFVRKRRFPCLKRCAQEWENGGLDQGIPWPTWPPSSDCPVVWHADVAPRRHRVRDQSSPQTRECLSPCPQGFYPPQK